MCFRIIVTSALLFPGVGALAIAQYPGDGGYPAYTGYYGGGATAAGSAASGAANVIQAQGQRNLSNSQAAINAEQARSMNLDNQLKYTQTYYEKQAIYNQHKQAEYAKDRRSAEDYKRYAHELAPKRLTYSQLDPVTGQLAWPDALTTDDYADSRQALDKLFAERASSSGATGYKKVTEIRKTAQSMQAKLKESISDIPPGDYIAAKSFLESVANEARYPAHNPPAGATQAG
jgi:hypothetical protein